MIFPPLYLPIRKVFNKEEKRLGHGLNLGIVTSQALPITHNRALLLRELL